MLVWLAEFFKELLHPLNVVHYVTFRAIAAALTALVATIIFGPMVIDKLTLLQIGQVVRRDGPESHYKKSGTPTMGGVLILLAIVGSVILWARLDNFYILVLLFTTISFGALGFYDDFKKLVLKHSNGLAARYKYLVQSVLAIIIGISLYWYAKTPSELQLLIPYTKQVVITLGLFYIIFTYFVIVGTSNAVNLTDGLDGLAIGPVILIAAALGIFAYVTGHKNFAEYLTLPYITGVGELAVFAGAMVGAGLGFLWFNAYPALIFMGDVGSLTLGALLGTMAVMVRQELILAIMGGVFVAETVSVILQVGSFKLTGKRIFKMAPVHHHFELSGWPEPRVIVRFWIITAVLVLIGLAALKIR